MPAVRVDRIEGLLLAPCFLYLLASWPLVSVTSASCCKTGRTGILVYIYIYPQPSFARLPFSLPLQTPLDLNSVSKPRLPIDRSIRNTNTTISDLHLQEGTRLPLTTHTHTHLLLLPLDLPIIWERLFYKPRSHDTIFNLISKISRLDTNPCLRRKQRSHLHPSHLLQPTSYTNGITPQKTILLSIPTSTPILGLTSIRPGTLTSPSTPLRSGSNFLRTRASRSL